MELSKALNTILNHVMSSLTSLKRQPSSEAIQHLVLGKIQASHDQLFDESFKSSNPVERLGELVGSVLVIVGSR